MCIFDMFDVIDVIDVHDENHVCLIRKRKEVLHE